MVHLYVLSEGLHLLQWCTCLSSANADLEYTTGVVWRCVRVGMSDDILLSLLCMEGDYSGGLCLVSQVSGWLLL
jgi:hypothetical protein